MTGRTKDDQSTHVSSGTQAGTSVTSRTEGGSLPAERSSSSEIAAFLKAAKSLASSAGRGRLIFALDATMSRQPTWDMAVSLQADMFRAAGEAAGFSVQLVYFRGLGECRASRWTGETAELARLMQKIDCRGGKTQIAKVLRHAAEEAARAPVSALVYIGDAMEENVDELCEIAGVLKLRKVACFMFHEGGDPVAAGAFREIARISGGAFARFDAGAAGELAALLRAVAAYASGGRQALETLAEPAARRLLTQLPKGPGRSG